MADRVRRHSKPLRTDHNNGEISPEEYFQVVVLLESYQEGVPYEKVFDRWKGDFSRLLRKLKQRAGPPKRPPGRPRKDSLME